MSRFGIRASVILALSLTAAASLDAAEKAEKTEKVAGKKITVFISGEKAIDEYTPPEATHLYDELKVKDGDPTGPILRQGDHKPIKYRYVKIKPVQKK